MKLEPRAESRAPRCGARRAGASLAIACLLAALGCATQVGNSQPGGQRLLPAVRRIAVLPPTNLTGDELVVSGASALEKYAFHSERVTVSDELAAFARVELARRGFEVVDDATVSRLTGGRVPANPRAAADLVRSAKLDATPLFIEIRRWDSDSQLHADAIIVDLNLVLVDPATGNALWEARHPTRPVSLHAAVQQGEAYSVVAEKLIEEMLAPLGERPAA